MAAPDVDHLILESRLALDVFREHPDGILVVDAAGVILMANRAASLVTGHTQAQLLGQSLEMLVPPELREAHAANRAAYLLDPRVRSMMQGFVLMHAQGATVHVEINLAPLATHTGVVTIAAIRRQSQPRE